MSSQNFYDLSPETVFEAAERLGFHPTGEFLQLNSFENRVFSIRLEESHDLGGYPDQIVGKFYRPGRWSAESIGDEHQFTQELLDEGLTCVPPIRRDGRSLFEINGLFYAFFPKTPGRLPQELVFDDLKAVGRLLARLHNVGSRKWADHRLQLDTSYYGGWDTLDDLKNWIAPEVSHRYIEAGTTILNHLESVIDDVDFLRIHGDCHRGNLLHDETSFFFIDFDDFVNGPAVQDFWMLLSWDDRIEEEKSALLEGYCSLRHFNSKEWDLVEYLRGLRIMGYAGWIAARWEDPTFRQLFPQFESYRYWAEEVEALEKIAWISA